MNELRKKLHVLMNSVGDREVLIDLIIDVVARSLGRLGGRPRNGACVCDENSKSGVSEPVTKPKKEHGSDLTLDLCLTPDPGPDPSKHLIRKSESDEPAGFVTFWAHYPRKDAKADARRAWKRRRPDLATCLAALEWQRKRPEWLTPAADGRSTIPLPASWINGERWNDERTPQAAARPQAAPAPFRPAQLCNWHLSSANNGKLAPQHDTSCTECKHARALNRPRPASEPATIGGGK